MRLRSWNLTSCNLPKNSNVLTTDFTPNLVSPSQMSMIYSGSVSISNSASFQTTGKIAQSQWSPEQPDRHFVLLHEGGCSVMAVGALDPNTLETSCRLCWFSLILNPYPQVCWKCMEKAQWNQRLMDEEEASGRETICCWDQLSIHSLYKEWNVLYYELNVGKLLDKWCRKQIFIMSQGLVHYGKYPYKCQMTDESQMGQPPLPTFPAPQIPGSESWGTRIFPAWW